MNIKIDDGKLLKFLIWVILGILGFNLIDEMIGGPCWQISRIFHLTEESNFTTWFSSLLLLIVSVYCFQIFQFSGDQKIKNLWAWIGVGFIFLSIDETAMIHENMNRCMERIFSMPDMNLEWVFYLCVSPFVAVFFIKYFKSLPWNKKSFWIFGLGVGLFILGASIVDALIYIIPHDAKVLSFLESFIEESLEMFGTIVMIKGLMELKGEARN